jgi:hypothetical protein
VKMFSFENETNLKKSKTKVINHFCE